MGGDGRWGRGTWQLADPFARSNEAVVPDVDACLRFVALALLEGPAAAAARVPKEAGGAETLKASLDYLRMRVGVPRDMSAPSPVPRSPLCDGLGSLVRRQSRRQVIPCCAAVPCASGVDDRDTLRNRTL